MKNYLPKILFTLAFAAGLTFGCGDDEGGGADCQPGTETCECATGEMCFSGLACSAGVCFPDAGSDSDTDTDGDSGGQAAPESDICDRADECNLLEAGISSMDCSDELEMCTDDLISSEKSDWTIEVETCLEFSNCKNFQGCVAELSACSLFEPDGGSCVPDGDPCDYCWNDTVCPAEYLGTGDGCDCNCSNGVDPDCG